MITIKAGLAADGHDQRTFCVQKGLLSFYSGYFRFLFNGPLKEAFNENLSVVTLNEDADMVERFVYWILLGTATHDDLQTPDADTFIDMWLFADRHDTTLLQNDMIDELHQFIIDSDTLPLHRLAEIYDKTPAQSTLRLMVAHAMSYGLDADSVSEAEQWPHEALADTLKTIVLDGCAKAFPDADYKFQNMCPEFHIHYGIRLCPVKEGKNTRGAIEWVEADQGGRV